MQAIIERITSKRGCKNPGFSQPHRESQNKGASLIIAVLSATIGTGVQALPETDVTTRFSELQQQQADILYTSRELSSLRVLYGHAQLWYLYKDPKLVYWSHEVKERFHNLEQVDKDMLTGAINNLNQISVMYPGSNPCTIVGKNSLECDIHNTQSINSWVQKRGQQLLAASDAVTWLSNWATVWADLLSDTDGIESLQQDIDQFVSDFPELPDYNELYQKFNAISVTLLADPSVAATVKGYAQTLSNDVQSLIDTTDYSTTAEYYHEQGQELIEANTVYQGLQEQATSVNGKLEKLQRDIHETIRSCYQYGYGNSCLDPQFDTRLKQLLPNYSRESSRILLEFAQLAEDISLFWYEYSIQPVVQTLRHESMAELQAALDPVLPELKEAQETFNQRVFSITVIQEQLGGLWSQLVRLGKKLGLE